MKHDDLSYAALSDALSLYLQLKRLPSSCKNHKRYAENAKCLIKIYKRRIGFAVRGRTENVEANGDNENSFTFGAQHYCYA